MKAKELVEQFNRQFPVGSRVRWRSVAVAGWVHKEYTVEAEARLTAGGQPVAYLVERSGMISIEPEFVDYDK